MPCGRRTSRRVVSGGREPLRLGQQACREPSPEGRGGLHGGRDLTPHVSGDEARGSELSGRRDVDFCHTPGLQRNSSFQSGLSARRMLGCVLGLPQGGGGAPAAGHGRGPQNPSRCPLGRILPQTRRLVWGFLSQNLALYHLSTSTYSGKSTHTGVRAGCWQPAVPSLCGARARCSREHLVPDGLRRG